MTDTLDRLLAEMDLSEVAGRPLADQALMRQQLDQLLQDLHALKAELDRLMIENMEEDQVTITGIGTLVRRQGGRRTKWQGERVRKALLNLFQPVDTETGEVINDPQRLADEAMLSLFSAAGLHRESHQWSTTELKKRGLKPGEFSEYVEGEWRLEIA